MGGEEEEFVDDEVEEETGNAFNGDGDTLPLLLFIDVTNGLD